jgi:hypothetical protein
VLQGPIPPEQSGFALPLMEFGICALRDVSEEHDGPGPYCLSRVAQREHDPLTPWRMIQSRQCF